MLSDFWDKRGWEVSKVEVGEMRVLREEHLVLAQGRSAYCYDGDQQRRVSTSSNHEVWSNEWPKQCRNMSFFWLVC